MDLESYTRAVPDFPIQGVNFRDLSPLLADPIVFRIAIDRLAVRHVQTRILEANIILGAEARGFIFGAALALKLGCGLVLARKPGKLPRHADGPKIFRCPYSLEYGDDCLEIQDDALSAESRVLVVDDVLATGGTALACRDLVIQAGGQVVGYAFVAEILGLGGREALGLGPVCNLMQF